jgi:hypothetical protein
VYPLLFVVQALQNVSMSTGLLLLEAAALRKRRAVSVLQCRRAVVRTRLLVGCAFCIRSNSLCVDDRALGSRAKSMR